jgi:hypothetical protein
LHLAVTIAFALVDVDHDPLGIDVADLELDQFASPYSEYKVMSTARCSGLAAESINRATSFLTEDDRQSAALFVERDFVWQVGPLESFHVEESQSGYVLAAVLEASLRSRSVRRVSGLVQTALADAGLALGSA